MNKFRIDNALHSAWLWGLWAVSLGWFGFGFFYVALNTPRYSTDQAVVQAHKILGQSAVAALVLCFIFGVWLFLRLLLYKQNLYLETERLVIPERMFQRTVMLYDIKSIRVTDEANLTVDIAATGRTYRVKFLYREDFMRFLNAGELKKFFEAS